MWHMHAMQYFSAIKKLSTDTATLEMNLETLYYMKGPKHSRSKVINAMYMAYQEQTYP